MIIFSSGKFASDFMGSVQAGTFANFFEFRNQMKIAFYNMSA